MTHGEELLEGPRGRRLCLQLALDLSQDLWSPVMHLAGSLDPGMGTSRAHLVARFDDDPPTLVREAPRPPAVADVARLLGRVDPTAVDDHRVHRAFAESVAAARGWQGPDGEDIMAALPEIRDALLPLAGQVMGTPLGRSLRAPRQPSQWHISFRGAEDPVRLLGDPGGELEAWAAATRAEEERAHHDRPADPRAPYGITWWSHAERLLQTVTRIPEALDLVEDAPGEEAATAVSVRGLGRTFEIETAEDWASLCRDHPLDVTASRRHSWFAVAGRDGPWVIPDWQSVAGIWDAVHLTDLAYLRTATSCIDVDGTRASVIAGWNPGTTIWLTDVAREWIEPRQHWRRSVDDAAWVPAH